MKREFQGIDRGKRVVTADGSVVGTIVRIDGDEAYVTPDSDTPATFDQQLVVDPDGETTYCIDTSTVDVSTNDRIRLSDE